MKCIGEPEISTTQCVNIDLQSNYHVSIIMTFYTPH